jgi:hypothetical protein
MAWERRREQNSCVTEFESLIHIWKHIYSKMIVAMHQNLGMMHRTRTDNDLPSKLCPRDLPSPGPQRPGILFGASENPTSASWKHSCSKSNVALPQNRGMMCLTKTDNDLPSKLCLWDLPSPGPSKGPAFYFAALENSGASGSSFQLRRRALLR